MNISMLSVLDSFRALTMHWEVPIFATLAYIVWVQRSNRRIRSRIAKREYCNTERIRSVMQRRRTKERTDTHSTQNRQMRVQSVQRAKSTMLKCAIFAHNAVMSVFSMVVFAHTFPVIWHGFWSMSFSAFILDSDKAMWRQISMWVWLFYLSKYYEIVDTAILFASEKESSFLQMYHHAGAIVACWLVSLSETYTGWIWVVLNSFIHSLMYLYYALTVFGIRPPFKRVLTLMQITQFFTGVIFGCFYITNPRVFSTDKTVLVYQISAVVYNIVYVTILTGLFIKFERDTYKKKTEKRECANTTQKKTKKRVQATAHTDTISDSLTATPTMSPNTIMSEA